MITQLCCDSMKTATDNMLNERVFIVVCFSKTLFKKTGNGSDLLSFMAAVVY